MGVVVIASTWRTNGGAVSPENDTVDAQEDTPLDSINSDCHPNYGNTYVPIVNYDVDCPDITGYVTVIGIDNHRFDRDKNGIGCEWN